MSAPVDLHSAAPEIITEPGLGILMARGNTVPSDGADGFAPGCIFIHTDGSGGTLWYANNGSNTSADFNPVGTAGVAASAAATAVDATVIDATYGSAEQGVIDSIRVSLNEVIACIKAHGLMAAS